MPSEFFEEDFLTVEPLTKRALDFKLPHMEKLCETPLSDFREFEKAFADGDTDLALKRGVACLAEFNSFVMSLEGVSNYPADMQLILKAETVFKPFQALVKGIRDSNLIEFVLKQFAKDSSDSYLYANELAKIAENAKKELLKAELYVASRA
ncbi:MAG: hypothetical protein Q7R64_03055 [bacterium]|nr:hypothetical protein [bacterium]